MTKEEMIEKLKNASQMPSKEVLISQLKCLPRTILVPNKIKKGDVFFYPAFNHPVVILKIKKDYTICSLLTSKEQEQSVPTNSRFFKSQYISKSLLIISVETFSKLIFAGMYDNDKHLDVVYKTFVEEFS